MLIGPKDCIDFQKTYNPITLKMNYMTFKNWNVVWFGAQGFYISEFSFHLFLWISKMSHLFVYLYKYLSKQLLTKFFFNFKCLLFYVTLNIPFIFKMHGSPYIDSWWLWRLRIEIKLKLCINVLIYWCILNVILTCEEFLYYIKCYYVCL